MLRAEELRFLFDRYDVVGVHALDINSRTTVIHDDNDDLLYVLYHKPVRSYKEVNFNSSVRRILYNYKYYEYKETEDTERYSMVLNTYMNMATGMPIDNTPEENEVEEFRRIFDNM